jgi:hypothetical protein
MQKLGIGQVYTFFVVFGSILDGMVAFLPVLGMICGYVEEAEK